MARQLRKPSGATGIQTGDMMNRSNACLYDHLLSVMQPANNSSLLEIGFGNGKTFGKILAAAKGLKISGIDHAPDMVNEAKQHNKEAIESGALSIYKGTSDQMPFPDNSFDKVYCINVIYFWNDPSGHLLEIKRVLRPGGFFYAVVRTVDTLNIMPFTRYGFNKFSDEKWKSLFEKEGFQISRIVPFSEPPFELDGMTFQFHAVCYIISKPVN